MSAKKPSKPKEFVNSPFRKLKGLSALESPSGNKVRGEKPVEPQRKPPETEDELHFDEQMAILGVAPLQDRKLENGEAKSSKRSSFPSAPQPSREEQDRSVFLEALGTLDTTFQDDWPDEPAASPAPPRRMKQVAQGRLVPEAQLDLHGLTVEQSSDKVRFFLENARHRGLTVVLVITGKGLHSSDEPVLRRAVERQLDTLRELVVEWGVAPRRYGGDGALVVFLRQQGAV